MPSLIGNKPNQVPSNGDLGTLAFQDANAVNITGGTATVNSLSNTGVTTVQAGTAAAPAITTTGDTNTGVFFPAADTIAFTEGGVEAMRIDSSANVGIGTTSPARKLTVSDTDQSTARVRIINTSGRTYDLVSGVDGLLQNGFSIFDATAAATRMTIDSSGNVLIGKTSATANGGDLQVSSGITFPATQVAKSDANTLDDYEEGTFTGTFNIGGTSNGTSTGRYTKIGRVVTYDINFFATGYTKSGTGSLTVTGMPFTSQTNSIMNGQIGYFEGYSATVNGFAYTQIPSASTTLSFVRGAAGNFQDITDTLFTTSTLLIRISGTYTTA
jgi:hypothetical protein